MGVDFFFVLGGFLITMLFFKEIQNTGAIAIGKFYIRRASDLAPVLFYFFNMLSGYTVNSSVLHWGLFRGNL